MPDFFTDIQDTGALKLAIEDNFTEFVAFVAQAGSASVIEDSPAMQRIITPRIPRSVYNTICRARLSADHTQAEIEAALDTYQQQGLPALWIVGPSSQPPNLPEQLAAQGLTKVLDAPGMALELAALPPANALPAGFVIERVANLAQLATWVEVSAAGFGNPGGGDSWSLHVYSEVGFSPKARLHNFIGWLDGEPVASATLFLGSRVAGMYSIATLPGLRGRGIGAAMTRQPLYLAREMGYQVGILHSSALGYRLYERVGFRTHCTLQMFQFTPA